MKTSQRLEQRTILSPRMQQSLRLLALNNVELDTAIAAEVETNPALERDAEPDLAPAAEPTPASELENLDWQAYFEDAGYAPAAGDTGGGDDPFGRLAQPQESLTQYLIRQLEAGVEDARELELALELVTALDRDGYLRVPLAALAEETGAAEAELERVLTTVVQKLDPAGVGARDLRECLDLQWRAGGETPAPAGVIIERHLVDLATKPPAAIAALLKTTPEETAAAVAYIRSLEPRPGRSFGAEVNVAVIPDVKVELVAGKPRVTFLDDAVGRLFVSPYYRDLLGVADSETRRFLRAKLAAAAWFVRAVHQRRRTLEKVAAAVFETQRDFLTEGRAGLKPLAMKDVAARVGLHVSTVSRAVADKLVDTPQGNYPLKYFFSGALTATGAEGQTDAVAVGKVKALLAELVANENKTAPFSDADLAAALRAQGVQAARRTVAKYRQELKIPGKYERQARV
jgi:RNA polymerase sigma-54 factor